jgi:very-short-patch-repair endonuclease
VNGRLPLPDGTVIMPDCMWSYARLVVELDTWDFHGTPSARARDNRRDRVLEVLEWKVFRVTPTDLTDARRADELAGQIGALVTVRTT